MKCSKMQLDFRRLESALIFHWMYGAFWCMVLAIALFEIAQCHMQTNRKNFEQIIKRKE